MEDEVGPDDLGSENQARAGRLHSRKIETPMYTVAAHPTGPASTATMPTTAPMTVSAIRAGRCRRSTKTASTKDAALSTESAMIV